MALFSDFKQLFYTFIVLSISLKVKLNINQCREILFDYHFLDKNALTSQLFYLQLALLPWKNSIFVIE